jgi:hypothetical protein
MIVNAAEESGLFRLRSSLITLITIVRLFTRKNAAKFFFWNEQLDITSNSLYLPSLHPAILAPPRLIPVPQLLHLAQPDSSTQTATMDAQIAEWQTRADSLKPLNLKQIEPSLLELDAHLTLRSHIVGYTLTDADTTVWSTLRGNRVANAYIKQGLMPSLCRWFKYIEEVYPQSVVVVPAAGAKEKNEGKNSDANYDIGLQDVGDGSGIVTRFPPEPS